MKLSPQGIDLLKWIEQLRLKPYDDQTGLPIKDWIRGATIGYGHLITSPNWSLYKDGIDEKEADFLFADDLLVREEIVNGTIKVPIEQHQYDALILLLYNTPTTLFMGSSAVRMINNPEIPTKFSTLEKAWKAWNKSTNNKGELYVNPGLVNRRASEWKLYSQGIYERW